MLSSDKTQSFIVKLKLLELPLLIIKSLPLIAKLIEFLEKFDKLTVSVPEESEIVLFKELYAIEIVSLPAPPAFAAGSAVHRNR